MSKVCLNGELIAAADARIDPSDRGFLLGDGLFETMAVKGGVVRRLDRHLARLHEGVAILGIPIEYDDEQLSRLIADTAAANDLSDASVRLTLTRGPGPRGVMTPKDATPTLMITAVPLAVLDGPVKLVIASGTRRNEQSPLSRVKSLNYLDNILARREAAARDADDAILLNTQGRVAETSIANIFALIDGGLVTPPITDGALPGVARADVIALARAEEKTLSPLDLKRASEVFVTNALGLRAVVAIDNQPVGDGETGLITQMLAARI
ncbi:MAG: aminotransferase class IV [Rhodobacteraceae bacterium]|nr:aminotransferase class IV [Paracoccaceae bacterium]